MNLYGFAGGDPANFSDPFGLCKKDKDGNDEANCVRVITALENAANDSDQEKGAGSGSLFRSAADVYRKTDREILFVSPDYWANNTDGDPTTYTMAQTFDAKDPVRFNRYLGAGDFVMSATHEALIHMENKDLIVSGHSGDSLGKQATNALNRQAFGQLASRWLPSAELWKRKVALY
jgi:hypothetical protein